MLPPMRSTGTSSLSINVTRLPWTACPCIRQVASALEAPGATANDGSGLSPECRVLLEIPPPCRIVMWSRSVSPSGVARSLATG